VCAEFMFVVTEFSSGVKDGRRWIQTERITRFHQQTTF